MVPFTQTAVVLQNGVGAKLSVPNMKTLESAKSSWLDNASSRGAWMQKKLTFGDYYFNLAALCLLKASHLRRQLTFNPDKM